MRFSCLYLPAVATMVLLPVGNLLAQESQAIVSPTAGTAAAAAAADTSQYVYYYDYADYDPIREFDVRVGWWGTKTTGSTVKTGEYQTLTPSSVFYNVDGLLTDGTRTLNLNATGVEDGSTQVKGTYFGPALEANLDYEQFPHELEHDPYSNWATTASKPTPPTPQPWVLQTHQDNNVGQDYAINVSQLNLNLKGEINDGLRWRVNVFSLEKSGERQQDATAHCYQAPGYTTASLLQSQCHTVSNSQYIDWKTNQIEPALEASNNWLTVEYSRTMRTFTQNDQMLYSDFDHTPSFGYGTAGPGFPSGAPGTGEAGYGIVPDSIFEMDRLKTRVQLDEDTEAYVLTYVGDEKDELNFMDRHLGGVDGRLTNNSIDGLTLTAHGKIYSENCSGQVTSLNTLYPSLASYYQQPQSVMNPADGLFQPIERDETNFGFTARWRPFYDCEGSAWSRLSINGGYDYGQIRRTYANDTAEVAVPLSFYQPDTDTNTFFVGVDEKWSEQFYTFANLKFINTAYPLYGVTPYISAVNEAVDTLLPTAETRMEIGTTWMPSERFLVNGTFYVEDASNHGPYAYFNSTNYPFLFSVMYAPTKCWHLTAGYANFDQNLTQNINIGVPSPTITPWTYESKADVFNVGTTYKLSPKVILNGNLEYVRGLDVITQSQLDLGQYSLVSNITYRISAGVDYLVRPNLTTFIRYDYFDYGALSASTTPARQACSSSAPTRCSKGTFAKPSASNASRPLSLRERVRVRGTRWRCRRGPLDCVATSPHGAPSAAQRTRTQK